MSSWSWKTGLAGAVIVAATAYAVAQMPSGHDGMHAQTGPNTQGQQPVPPESGMHGPMHERMMQMMQRRPAGNARRDAARNEGSRAELAVNPPCRDRRRSGQSRRSCKS